MLCSIMNWISWFFRFRVKKSALLDLCSNLFCPIDKYYNSFKATKIYWDCMRLIWVSIAADYGLTSSKSCLQCKPDRGSEKTFKPNKSFNNLRLKQFYIMMNTLQFWTSQFTGIIGSIGPLMLPQGTWSWKTLCALERLFSSVVSFVIK